jgi:hypothetical protein
VFWPDTGDVHQNYYILNPQRYSYYKNGCGRVQRLKAVWGNDEYYKYHDPDPAAINLTVTNAAGEEVPAVLYGDPALRDKGEEGLPDFIVWPIVAIAAVVLLCGGYGAYVYHSKKRASEDNFS